MASFSKAFRLLQKAEFKDCCDALHKNPTEQYFTFMGIYQKYYPESIIWQKMRNTAQSYNCQLTNPIHVKGVSCYLSHNKIVLNEVKTIYKKDFWDKICGDKIKNQKVAENIFLFAVNVGVKTAIRLAQKIVKAKVDGVCGKETLSKINATNPAEFNERFNLLEKRYYIDLVKANPKLSVYKTGWLNRAVLV